MMCFSKLFFQLHTLAVDLVPKSESEEPPREDPGHFGGLTLSQILGLDLPQSLSSSQPLFHPPPESDQPQHQDLASSSRPTHPHIPPPPMTTPSHHDGLSDFGFFSQGGFIAVDCKGQPDKTPGISSQINQYVDIDQKPPLGFEVNGLAKEIPHRCQCQSHPLNQSPNRTRARVDSSLTKTTKNLELPSVRNSISTDMISSFLNWWLYHQDHLQLPRPLQTQTAASLTELEKSGNLGTRFLVHFRPKFGK